ncbi:expressed unknown protein [Seminavis robusta]|uniref:Peptidase A2 domain-containing protein n=1 Tax=Seminavis robusta TaxID=568900 RepID=A0A9N8DTL5_9STRA|nr:expressed unknown protein [Seminavis robusta]|eukprot:Sro361_g126540.1 n/a (392) ;mRNA; f:39859-41034
MKFSSVLILALQISTCQGFVLPNTFVSKSSHLFSTVETKDLSLTEQDEQLKEPTSVRAPLKFMGPYPCLGLKFPHLATSAQRAKNMSGISLDFLLDTAANVNTINSQVATELQLSEAGEALPGVSAAGSMGGGTTYMLGDCELEGVAEEASFMQELTASALPVESPASAGLLSLPFFHCFEGGVEFDWVGQQMDGKQLPPSVTFYGPGDSDAILQDITRVKIEELPVTRLPMVQLNINNMTIPALLDTGSPITVINAQAAKEAGIETAEISTSNDDDKKGGNLFSNFANRFQQAQAAAQAAARGDLITIAGADGKPVQLIKSQSEAGVHLASDDDEIVDFGNSNIYVGNLPGLAALNGLGDESPPAAVLGMDILRKKPKMLLLARNQEVYF